MQQFRCLFLVVSRLSSPCSGTALPVGAAESSLGPGGCACPRLRGTTGSTLWVLEDTTQVCFHGKLLVRHMKTVLEGKLAGIDFFL